MDERPLFGAGSQASKHALSQAAFLQPATSVDGRQRAVSEIPHSRPIPQTQVPQTQVPQTPVSHVPVQQPVASPTQPVVSSHQEVPDGQTGSKEERKEARKRTLKGGLIVLPGQMMSSYACKIRNESRGGLMLVVSDPMLLPSEFYLVRDADPGHKIPCCVAWRGIGRIGVQFIAALATP